MYHKLLQQQLQKHCGDTPTLPENLLPVFKEISDVYDNYDNDRRQLERSLELSSNELLSLNKKLQTEKDDLQEALKSLKLFFENVNELLYSMDMTTYRLIKMADVCEKIYGYPAADFIADVNLWQKVIHPEDRHIASQGMVLLSQGKSVFNQYRIIHRDGSIRWLDNKVIPTMNEAGKLVRIDGVSSDVTEQKNAEIELEKSVSLLEATLESTADGIMVAGNTGQVIRYNKKFLELWKLPSELADAKDDEEALQFVTSQLLEPEAFLAKVKALYSQPGEVSFDILRFKDGRTFERYSQPQMINDACIGRVWSFRDVSQRVNIMEDLRRSEAKLEGKNRELESKNKELEQFAYVASHDLQEPLRTSISFIALIRQQYYGKLDATADKYLDFVLQASERMQMLIKDLLDYSRIGRKTALAVVDCNATVTDVLRDLNAAINETGATIITQPLPVINSYSTELKQLFQNLIINAIKFRKKELAPQIYIAANKTDAGWEFSVRDNGIGMEQKHSERIFVIFQRLHTRTEYEGSGIGLSHCKKIAELHGGRIWVESAPGEGSTFYFTIPQNHGA